MDHANLRGRKVSSFPSLPRADVPGRWREAPSADCCRSASSVTGWATLLKLDDDRTPRVLGCQTHAMDHFQSQDVPRDQTSSEVNCRKVQQSIASDLVRLEGACDLGEPHILCCSVPFASLW